MSETTPSAAPYTCATDLTPQRSSGSQRFMLTSKQGMFENSRMNCCEFSDCPVQASRLLLMAKFFKGLADPTRLSILQALIERPLRVVDLCARTGRAQPNVSAHLACLRDCGLVEAAPRGRETYYSVAEGGIVSILSAADDVIVRHGSQICQRTNYDSQD